MQWIDLAVIAIIGLSILTGLFRGFVKELISVTAWIMAIWMSIHYASLLDPWLSQYIHQEAMRSGVAFLIILFSTLLAGGIVNATLSFVLKKTGLSGTDRVLGMGFGFVRGVFIISLMIAGIRLTGVDEQDYRKGSMFYTKFDPVVNWVAGFMPHFIKNVKELDLNKEPEATHIAADL